MKLTQNEEKRLAKIEDKEQILKLNHGEHLVVPEGDYGKAEIWFINDRYFLFKILPIFDEQPLFFKSYQKNEIDKMIHKYFSWS